MPTVLLLEDCLLDVEYLLLHLEHNGCDVVHCATQDEGRRIFETWEGEPFYAIILDGMMPMSAAMAAALPTTELLHLILGSGFDGLIVSTASDSDVRKEQLQIGATSACQKGDLLSHFRGLLARDAIP